MNIPPREPDFIPDIVGELSDWSCDTDICGICGPRFDGPCPACKHRARVAKLLAQRDLERRPCTLGCTPDRTCDRCREVNSYLSWLYQQRDQVAVLLRLLRQIADVFPDELRELLAEPVADIITVREGGDA
ncbi:MAG TPA: hypothetical protein VFE62_08070 [Gemmataceae bacterium]|nr:hypothetical protein [Gemmataceae bacterium]